MAGCRPGDGAAAALMFAATLIALAALGRSALDASRPSTAVAGLMTPTGTPSPTATATPLPTPTAPPAPPGMEKLPRGGDDNVILGGPMPLANLFICEDTDPSNEPDGLCDLENEGQLVFIERAYTAVSPAGGFAFKLGFDEAIFDIDVSCVTPQDPDPACTGDSDDDGILNTDADTWDIRISQQIDNDPYRSWGMDQCSREVAPGEIAFACTSSGPPDAGQTGGIDLADVTVHVPQDLSTWLANSEVDALVRVISDVNCALVDPAGLPVSGSVAGGLTAGCGDVAITVRALEGDMNLDCRVNLIDVQAVAHRYGATLGSLLYDRRYDLEPDEADFDIDAKDLQKVAGRTESTCQHPLPAQPPLDPAAEG